jgi:hypothetical protein
MLTHQVQRTAIDCLLARHVKHHGAMRVRMCVDIHHAARYWYVLQRLTTTNYSSHLEAMMSDRTNEESATRNTSTNTAPRPHHRRDLCNCPRYGIVISRHLYTRNAGTCTDQPNTRCSFWDTTRATSDTAAVMRATAVVAAATATRRYNAVSSVAVRSV